MGVAVLTLAAALLAAGVLVLRGRSGPTRPANLPRIPHRLSHSRLERPPNIVLISIDTLRADHVSSYGYERPTTPVLDSLAAHGTLYEQAFTPAPWTLPAHMSAFTGLPPSAHHVETEHDSLPPDVLMVTEALRFAGYRTAAFVSHVFVGRTYGFAEGFDTFVEEDEERRAEQVTDRALQWLDDSGTTEPLFLFVHYFDPHWNYDPPEPYGSMFGAAPEDHGKGIFTEVAPFADPSVRPDPETLRRLVALYDGEIRYTDSQIGRLLEGLARHVEMGRTIVVVMSDHGEEFDERASFGHGHSFHPEVARVPLVISGAGASGRRIRTPVSLYDLPATLSVLAGVEVPEQFLRFGRDLLALGQEGSAKRALLSESTRRGPKRFAVIEDSWKYISPYSFFLYLDRKRYVSVPEGLYDLATDPAERRNRLASPDSEATALAEAMRQRLHDQVVKETRAVVLTCRPSENRSERFAGDFEFSSRPADEPFGIGFQEGDRIEPQGFGTRYRFSFVAASAKSVALPVSAGEEQITLVVTRGGRPYFRGELTTTAASGRITELRPGSRRRGGCWVTRPERRLRGGEPARLSDSEIERLRRLGYLP